MPPSTRICSSVSSSAALPLMSARSSVPVSPTSHALTKTIVLTQSTILISIRRPSPACTVSTTFPVGSVFCVNVPRIGKIQHNPGRFARNAGDRELAFILNGPVLYRNFGNNQFIDIGIVYLHFRNRFSQGDVTFFRGIQPNRCRQIPASDFIIDDVLIKADLPEGIIDMRLRMRRRADQGQLAGQTAPPPSPSI